MHHFLSLLSGQLPAKLVTITVTAVVFKIQQKSMYVCVILSSFCFVLLLLLLGDEVDFSAGFPARPVGSLGGPYPIRLAARPTRSSYSAFLHNLLIWVGPGLPSSWLSGYQLADGPTRPSYSVALVPISLRVSGDRSQPSGKSKVSREDTTL